MGNELFLGIPGVDIPYPKYVQDALDFIQEETRTAYRQAVTPIRDKEGIPIYDRHTGRHVTTAYTDEKFWKVRKAQKAAQQKKQPYQQIDRADQWPSW